MKKKRHQWPNEITVNVVWQSKIKLVHLISRGPIGFYIHQQLGIPLAEIDELHATRNDKPIDLRKGTGGNSLRSGQIIMLERRGA
jgi:hypothetical protein